MPDFPHPDLIGINIKVSCSRPGCAPQHPCQACLEIIGYAGLPCPDCGTLLKPVCGDDGQFTGFVDGAGQSHDCDMLTPVSAELRPPRLREPIDRDKWCATCRRRGYPSAACAMAAEALQTGETP